TVLAVIDVATGKVARPCDALDLWPNAPVWSSDGATIWFTADERGDVPIFAVDVASGRVRRVAVGGGYSDVRPSPDGKHVYALFPTFDRPPEVVFGDAGATDGIPKKLTRIAEPMLEGVPMGKVERITSKSADGRSVDSFLVRAADAKEGEKRPLILWVHGGPI